MFLHRQKKLFLVSVEFYYAVDVCYWKFGEPWFVDFLKTVLVRLVRLMDLMKSINICVLNSG